MVVVMGMVFLVNVLLLFATGRFLDAGAKTLRILIGSLFGALFAAWSMIPGFGFLEHFLWRLCALALTALLAFGFSRHTFSEILLFALLHLSLGGVTGGEEEMLPMLLGSAGMGLACVILGKGRRLIPVELTYGAQTLHLTALRDTGNTLRDPVTGQSVLIVDAATAQKLTGLDPAALQDPVKNLGNFPGLRLIPYQTVGNTGFLLAVRISNAKIGSKQGSAIVAFSPQILGSNYQALTGGTV